MLDMAMMIFGGEARQRTEAEYNQLFSATGFGPARVIGTGTAFHILEANRVSSMSTLNDFAIRYTAAWCSQNAAIVAAHFAERGSLTINGDEPAIGRAAITAAAQGFMTDFPDMVVKMDRLEVDGSHIEYHWTLTGTNTGPGGTGRPVRISGVEQWRIGADGLIEESKGQFDEADYQRQLSGAEAPYEVTSPDLITSDAAPGNSRVVGDPCGRQTERTPQALSPDCASLRIYSLSHRVY